MSKPTEAEVIALYQGPFLYDQFEGGVVTRCGVEVLRCCDNRAGFRIAAILTKHWHEPVEPPRAPRYENQCAKCGGEMIHNVPRIGSDGGFIHAATGQFLCGEKGDKP